MIPIRPSAAIIPLLFLFVAGLVRADDAWSLSYSLEAQGNYSKAIQALSPVVKEEPDNEFARLRIAWLKYLNRDYNASIRDYERALDINELSLDAMLGTTLPLLAQGRWREAEKAATSVLTIAPWNYYAHLRLLVAIEGQAKWDELAERASALAARYPSDATALVYLARAEARRGNTVAALDVYNAVLARVPGHAEAVNYIASNAN
jgi:tetratricopeptide (TPR) repeat protein